MVCVRACVRTYRADLVVIAHPKTTRSGSSFVALCFAFCMRCGGMAACVGGGVDTDIRTPGTRARPGVLSRRFLETRTRIAV